MKIFNLDAGEGESSSGCGDVPLCTGGYNIKIFDLPDDSAIDIKLFLPGPPGERGPTGPAGPPSLPAKAGVVLGSSFSGSPRKYAVVFATPFTNTAYTIALSGTDGRTYTYENKLASGFTINANADAVISGEVSWLSLSTGEIG